MDAARLALPVRRRRKKGVSRVCDHQAHEVNRVSEPGSAPGLGSLERRRTHRGRRAGRTHGHRRAGGGVGERIFVLTAGDDAARSDE